MSKGCKPEDARIGTIIDLYGKKLKSEAVLEDDTRTGDSVSFTVLWGEEDYTINITISFRGSGKAFRMHVDVSHKYTFSNPRNLKVASALKKSLISLEYKDSFKSDDDGCKYNVGDVEIDEGLIVIDVYRSDHLVIDVPAEVSDEFIKKVDSKVLEFSNGLWRAMNEEIQSFVKGDE